ncbi:MAG TPA: hypothetical protein VGB49_03460 [Caulobacteraceae bacterium]|jgi:hypothetical protein
MTRLLTLTAAAAALCAGAAFAQAPRTDITNNPIPAQGGLSTPNSVNTTGPAVGNPTGSRGTMTGDTSTQGSMSTSATTGTSSRMYSSTTATMGATTSVTASQPVPDTAENRRRYGQPMSNAGKRSAARGN